MVPELYGFLIGVVAGLIPGIHPNTFASLMLGTSLLLSEFFNGHELALMIFVSSVVYSVVNIIPAVFVGVPDEDTAVAVFPAHKMVLDGKGMMAVSISAISSFMSAIISLPLFYLLIFFKDVITFASSLTLPVLILVSLHLIMLEDDPFGGSMSKWKKRGLALFIFILSGFLGYASITRFDSNEISILFPLLSGLFGFPTLMAGMTSEKIPEQSTEMKAPSIRNVLRGTLSGLFVSIFPGISSGVATALSIGRKDDEAGYVASMSSANTANTILNFAMLISAGKVRSGAAQAFSYFVSPEKFIFLPLIGLASAFSAFAFTLLISFPASKMFQQFNPSRISAGVLVFLIFATFLTNGFAGIAVFAVAGIIGILTLYFGVRRIHCMGSIILPAILFRI